MFKSQYIYLQVRKGEMSAQNMETGERAVTQCAALTHPRTLMGDFVEIESCIKAVTGHVVGNSFFKMPPIAVVQLIVSNEGGYTNVEIRAFKEAVTGAGFRRVLFPDTQSELTLEAIRHKNFTQHKGV